MTKSPFPHRKFLYPVFSLLLLVTLALGNAIPAHGATIHLVKSTSCNDNVRFQGTNTDSTGVYTVSLAVHYVWSFGCNPYYYTVTQAYVAQGYSFNIRVCTGHAPESAHRSEVCHDYSGYAGLGGWYSPVFYSYTWWTYGCNGYADIIGHTGLASSRSNCP